MLNLDVVHEDAMMNFFVSSLDDDVMNWFRDLGKGNISSYASLIESFSKQSDPNFKEEETLEDLVEACQVKEIIIQLLMLDWKRNCKASNT